MSHISRDTIVAIVLLVLCGVFFHASFEIREPDYGVLPPSAWPRVIIAALTLLSFVYLVQSISAGRSQAPASDAEQPSSLAAFLAYWRNPIYCFVLFLAFLLALPTLGMLFGGMAFVFLLLNMLGGWAPKQLLLHAVIAVVAIGVMWSIFTFGLNVILPPGMFYNPLN